MCGEGRPVTTMVCGHRALCAAMLGLCGAEYTPKPMGRIVANCSLVSSSRGVHPSVVALCVVGLVGLVLHVRLGTTGVDNDVWTSRPMCCDVGYVWCGVHAKPYGPNTREIVVGVFVAWCPPECCCVGCGVGRAGCCMCGDGRPLSTMVCGHRALCSAMLGLCGAGYTPEPMGRLVAK